MNMPRSPPPKANKHLVSGTGTSRAHTPSTPHSYLWPGRSHVIAILCSLVCKSWVSSKVTYLVGIYSMCLSFRCVWSCISLRSPLFFISPLVLSWLSFCCSGHALNLSSWVISKTQSLTKFSSCLCDFCSFSQNHLLFSMISTFPVPGFATAVLLISGAR